MNKVHLKGIAVISSGQGAPQGEKYFTNEGHPLMQILSRMRGRPRERAVKPGQKPWYSERLAIKCAIMKRSGHTYLEIGKQFRLRPSKRYYDSEQNDQARQLVEQGELLLAKYANDRHT